MSAAVEVEDPTGRTAVSRGAEARLSMRELAQRILIPEEQNRTVRDRMHRITTELAPDLVAKTGVRPDTATTLLITAGDNLTGSATRSPSPRSSAHHRSR